MAAHAKLSASGSKRWLKCTLSAAIESAFPEEDSNFSREGTCAHAVANCRLLAWLMRGTAADQDETLVGGYAEFYNPDFESAVASFVSYTQQRVQELFDLHGEDSVIVLLEQRLDFSRWVPEGFGTGDVVAVYPGGILVIDLKFGAGVYVSPFVNSQLRLYALGAYDRLSTVFDVDSIETVIHQPRKDNVSGETFSTLELLEWADELVVPRAKIAWAALQGDRSEARYSPGPHCHETFCKARFVCGARARYAMELEEMPEAGNDIKLLSVDQLEDLADRADHAIKWASDARRFLLAQANNGHVELKRYKLTEGRSERTIVNETVALSRLMAAGYKLTDISGAPVTKIKGVGALDALVGGSAKLAEILGDAMVKPPGALKLISRDSPAKAADPRPPEPTGPSAQEAFGSVTD